MQPPLFSTFAHSADARVRAEGGSDVDSARLFQQASTDEMREQIVSTALVGMLARSLSMVPDDVDTAKPMFEYEVDSLVAVELRNWMSREFGMDVAVFDILGGSTIATVSALITRRSKVEKRT